MENSTTRRYSCFKGKIDINATIKKNTLVNKKVAVVYEEFSENVVLNQIIKATLIYLSRSNKINQIIRRLFHELLPYFTEVSDVELDLKLWKNVRYNRQNMRMKCLCVTDHNGYEIPIKQIEHQR